MKGQLVYRFLVLNLWGFFISFFLQWLLFCHLIKNLWSSISCFWIKQFFWLRTLWLASTRLLKMLIIILLSKAFIFLIFAFRSTGCQCSASLRYNRSERELLFIFSKCFYFACLFHPSIPQIRILFPKMLCFFSLLILRSSHL